MNRRTFRRAIAAGGATIVFVAMTAGAADAATAPKKWGKQFCSALVEWGNDLQTGAEELAELDGASISPTEGKAILVDFLDATAQTTAEFHEAVSKAGDPAVTNGKQIQQTILDGITGVEAQLESRARQAEELPTTSAEEFQTAASPLESQVRAVSAPFEDAMDEVGSLEKKKELSKALGKVKACRAIG